MTMECHMVQTFQRVTVTTRPCSLYPQNPTNILRLPSRSHVGLCFAAPSGLRCGVRPASASELGGGCEACPFRQKL